MSKVYLTKQEKLNEEFYKWLVGSMKYRKLRQHDIAKKLGITQQGFSHKMSSLNFQFSDIVSLFEILKPDADTVMRLFGMQDGERKQDSFLTKSMAGMNGRGKGTA